MRKQTRLAKKRAAKVATKGRKSPVVESLGLELVGRLEELRLLEACLTVKKNVLLEGPVGVGKTRLALAVIDKLGLPSFRVDGDNRFTEQKLTGWFDPPAVLKKGYTQESFQAGPLVRAMKEGGVLFINELNRLPEGVQNVLLPAIDERFIEIPRLGRISAHESFLVVATQNPKEFVATSHLSEALLDRFELVILDYQSEEEEFQMVRNRLAAAGVSNGADAEKLCDSVARFSVNLARITRGHPRVRRGASVRAAMSVGEIALALVASGASLEEALKIAGRLALPTRIEIERDPEAGLSLQAEFEILLEEWLGQIFQKKKN